MTEVWSRDGDTGTHTILRVKEWRERTQWRAGASQGAASHGVGQASKPIGSSVPALAVP